MEEKQLLAFQGHALDMFLMILRNGRLFFLPLERSLILDWCLREACVGELNDVEMQYELGMWSKLTDMKY